MTGGSRAAARLPGSLVADEGADAVRAGARRLRIAQVAPPMEAVPPAGYGGTERVVAELVRGLLARGHRLTTFASGDSDVPGELVATVERALRPLGFTGDPGRHLARTLTLVEERLDDFDVVHLHLEARNPAGLGVVAGRAAGVATFHGRLDLPWARQALRGSPRGIVAVSRSQAAPHPTLPWTIIPNGLDLTGSPFRPEAGDGLCFVGRIAPEKGAAEAIELARLTGRSLLVIAKVGVTARERAYNEAVFRPALAAAGSLVEFVGELGNADRDALLAESYATVMPGRWPEPFGLVAIESMATGTPILASRVGALPEIVRHGIDGFLGDDVQSLAFAMDDIATLDRRRIRAGVLERFSAERMIARYEALYDELLAGPASRRRRRGAATARAAAQPASATRTRPTSTASLPS